MYHKKAKSLINAWTVIGIIFIFAIVIAIIKNGGEELLAKDLAGEIELNEKSVTYIGKVNNIDTSNYQATKQELEDSAVTGTAGTPKDYAMEFLYSKERGALVENPVKLIFSIPSTIIYTLFNQPVDRFAWLIDIIGWLLGISVSIAIYLYVRGRA